VSNEDDATAHRSVRADPLALSALGLGLSAFVLDCCCGALGLLLSLLAVILGAVVVAKARKGPRADTAIGISAIVAGVSNLLLFAVLAVFYAGLLMHDGGDIFPVYPDGPPPSVDASAPLGAGGPLLPGFDAGFDAGLADSATSDAMVP